MNMLEIEGKTIDDAIKKACSEFNVPREKLNIEIISEGSSGFLGIGSKKAFIKAGIRSTIDVEEPYKSKGATSDKSSVEIDTPKSAFVISDKTTAIRAKDILEGILARMNLDFPVEVDETPEFVTLNIKGDGNGLLIGKKGQTLDALQAIVNIAANKHGKDKKRIVIDTEEYRKRRTESLTALAEKLGRKVKTTNRPVTVGNLNSHDRRIIHMALRAERSLITKSKGEGTYRKIIILPSGKE